MAACKMNNIIIVIYSFKNRMQLSHFLYNKLYARINIKEEIKLQDDRIVICLCFLSEK